MSNDLNSREVILKDEKEKALLNNKPYSNLNINSPIESFKDVRPNKNKPYSQLKTYTNNQTLEINEDDNINGCIIQLPLPNHINSELILNRLNSNKDVDCFTDENIGKLLNNESKFYPATPYGITLLLDNYNILTKGKNITIIGKSRIVGTPLALLLSNENKYAGTVTLCDKNTINLKDHIEEADILIVCAGVHHLIDKKYKVKETSTLIDVGIHRIPDSTKKNGYRLEGDIDFNYFENRCSYITPVPGGVGPMTVYALLLNISKTIC